LLKRKLPDKFFSFDSLTEYKAKVKAGLNGLKSSRNFDIKYIEYLDSLVDYSANEAKIKKLFEEHKKVINVAEVTKYYGEVLGPIYMKNHLPNPNRIIFPQRSNYELFDFFLEDSKNVHGFSSKQLSGSSNTLAPNLVLEKFKGMTGLTPLEKHTAEVLRLIDAAPTSDGMFDAVDYLVKHAIFPNGLSNDAKNALKNANIKDAKRLTTYGDLDRDARFAGLKIYIDSYVVPRLKGSKQDPMTEEKKKAYISGNSPYSRSNIAYSLIMYIADCSKQNLISPTNIIKKSLPELNILKMGLSRTGMPIFELHSVYDAGRYDFRSKARWTKVKDKLGIQL
jgi:hypothetical protein